MKYTTLLLWIEFLILLWIEFLILQWIEFLILLDLYCCNLYILINGIHSNSRSLPKSNRFSIPCKYFPPNLNEKLFFSPLSFPTFQFSPSYLTVFHQTKQRKTNIHLHFPPEYTFRGKTIFHQTKQTLKCKSSTKVYNLTNDKKNLRSSQN